MKWEKMDSAPMDGRRVLLWVPPYGPSTGHFDYNVWHCHSVLNKEAEPTRWMEIPSPDDVMAAEIEEAFRRLIHGITGSAPAPQPTQEE